MVSPFKNYFVVLRNYWHIIATGFKNFPAMLDLMTSKSKIRTNEILLLLVLKTFPLTMAHFKINSLLLLLFLPPANTEVMFLSSVSVCMSVQAVKSLSHIHESVTLVQGDTEKNDKFPLNHGFASVILSYSSESAVIVEAGIENEHVTFCSYVCRWPWSA